MAKGPNSRKVCAVFDDQELQSVGNLELPLLVIHGSKLSIRLELRQCEQVVLS